MKPSPLSKRSTLLVLWPISTLTVISLFLVLCTYAAGQQGANPSTPEQPAVKSEAKVEGKAESKGAAKTAEAKSDGKGTGKSESQKGEATTPIQPWEYAPYRIRVWVAAKESAETDAKFLEQLYPDLVRRADAVVGAPWTMTAVAAPEKLHTLVATSIESVTDADIFAVQSDALKDDKIFLVSLDSNPIGTLLRVRELDCHARTWSRVVTREIRQPDALNRSVFDAVVDAFSPLARIEEGQPRTCIVRVRGGGLVLDPKSPAFIGKGDILQPVNRQNDKFGNPLPGKVSPIALTFLHVTSANETSPSLLNCNIHSALRGPIGVRTMSRRERWAIKTKPSTEPTELLVQSKPNRPNEPIIPLAGVEIYSKTPSPDPPKEETEEERIASEKANPPQLLGVTDWRGTLIVPGEGPTLRVMYIKNGGQLLARLPVVAGFEKRVMAEIPDDNPRLQAEGFVKGLNGEITDLVVQRQLLKLRAKKKIAQGKLDEAKELLEEFRKLRMPNELQRMLDQQMERGEKTTNPSVKMKIDKLYSDEREMIAKYVDVEILNQLTQELEQARANPQPPETDTETEKKGDDKGAVPAAADTKREAAAANPSTARNPP